METLAVIGGFAAVIGSLFLLLASIGVIRMPDTYNRMQTGTKATTLGSMLFFLGLGLASPAWWGKLASLIIFIFITNPLSSHVLVRALHFTGKSPILPSENEIKSTRDDLAENKPAGGQNE